MLSEIRKSLAKGFNSLNPREEGEMKNFLNGILITLILCMGGIALAASSSHMSSPVSTMNLSNNQVTDQQTIATKNTQLVQEQKLSSKTSICVFGNTYDKTNFEIDPNSYLVVDPNYAASDNGNEETNPTSPRELLLPANDNCVDVTPVTLVSGVTSTFTGNNTDATNDCSILGSPEVWEAFTIDECMDVRVDYCGTSPNFWVLFSAIVQGCPCGSLIRPINYSFGICPDHNGSMLFSCLAPGTYYVPVFTGGPSVGNYVMNVLGVACPPAGPNDNCSDAIAIGDTTDLPFTTRYATHDGPGTYIESPNIWFIYTASCTGNATLNLLNSNYDSKVAIYDGASCDPLGTMLAYNDDFMQIQSCATFPVVSGQQYLIEIGGYGTSIVGNGKLTLSCDPAPPNDNCGDVTPSTLTPSTPLTFTGTNIGASSDCPNNSMYPEVWEAFTTTECMDVRIDYCGTSPEFNNIYGVINTGCPCSGMIYCSTMSTSECTDGNFSIHFTALPAGTYYVPILLDIVHRAHGAYTINISGVACPPPPPNDNCVDVTPVALTPDSTLTFEGNNTGATNDCPALGTTPEVWEAFTTTECMYVTIDLCGTNPAFSTVYNILIDACPCGNTVYSQVTNFDICGDGNATFRFFDLPAGTYYVPIYTSAQSMGQYTMHISGMVCPPPPANDNCENAIELTIPSSVTGTTYGATADGAPTCFTAITSPGVWYKVTGNGHQLLASTCADYTDFNTQVNVYKNGCGQLECVSGNNDSCDLSGYHNGNSKTLFCTETGVEYYILVLGFMSEMGQFQLDISDGESCQPPPATPTCEASSLFGQSPTEPGGYWNFMASDAYSSPIYVVKDNYSGITGDISSIKFWGIDIYFANGFFECFENPTEFEVVFYADNNGAPGDPVAVYDDTISPEPTGLYYYNFELNEYNIPLVPSCTLSQGWVSVQGISVGGTIGNCWFYWANSQMGDGVGLQNDSLTGEDMAFCLQGGAPCEYMQGDINGDGQRIGGDVTYGVRYFKGTGATPIDSCFMDSTGAYIYVSGDVNGNCEFRGSDITRLVAFFKGTAQISYCHFFPPPPLRDNKRIAPKLSGDN
jgi:hypothetical protein